MQWVIHGNLTPAVAAALKRHDEKVHDFAELGLPPDAGFREILWAANRKQWDLLTNDSTLIQWLYDDRFPFQRCIVFMQLPGGDVEQDDAIDRLFARYKRLSAGRLYTITASRVKIRQLPTGTKGPRAVEAPEEDSED